MQSNAPETGSVKKQLIIENHLLLVCPHCWTKDEIARDYPELAGYRISDHLCNTHFEILLARAMSSSQSDEVA